MVGGHHPNCAQRLKPMRILLRNFQTGTFFKTATLWTTDQNEALDFEDHDVAVRVVRELRLQNIEILHVTEDGGPLFGTRV
jgi:hypothetical protein